MSDMLNEKNDRALYINGERNSFNGTSEDLIQEAINQARAIKTNIALENINETDIDQLINDLNNLANKSKESETIFYKALGIKDPFLGTEAISKNSFLNYFNEGAIQRDWIDFLTILSDPEFTKRIVQSTEDVYHNYKISLFTYSTTIDGTKGFQTTLQSNRNENGKSKKNSTYLQIRGRTKSKSFIKEQGKFRDNFEKEINQYLQSILGASFKEGNITSADGNININITNEINKTATNIISESLIEQLAKYPLINENLLSITNDNITLDISIEEGSNLLFNLKFKNNDNNSIKTVSNIRNESNITIQRLCDLFIEIISSNLNIFYKNLRKTSDGFETFLDNTINHSRFQTILKETIKQDYENFVSENNKNKTIKQYITSKFASETNKNDFISEKKYNESLTGKRSILQGTIGEIIETALIKWKALTPTNGYKIEARVMGQERNILSQEGHADIRFIITDPNNQKTIVNMQAKQYNSADFMQSKPFYNETTYNVFNTSAFIRYVGERPVVDKDQSIDNFISQMKHQLVNTQAINNKVISILQSISLYSDNGKSTDVTKYLYPYYNRFTRVEDMCEVFEMDQQEISMNNFISFNFGLLPMSYILNNIAKDLAESRKIERMFMLNGISVNETENIVIASVNKRGNILNMTYSTEDKSQSKNFLGELEFTGLRVNMNKWIKR